MTGRGSPHLPVSSGRKGPLSKSPEIVVVEMVANETSTDPSAPSKQIDCADNDVLSAEKVNGMTKEEGQKQKQEGQSDPSPHHELPDLQPGTDQTAGLTQSSGEGVSDRLTAKKKSGPGDQDVHGNLDGAVQYLETLEKRLKDLEEKIQKPPKDRPAEGDESSKSEARRVVIPEIKRVNWYHFKNKKMRKNKQFGVTPPNRDASLLEGKSDAAIARIVPERVRIWSIPILLILAELNNSTIDSMPTHIETHLRPFKTLLRFRDDINVYIETLEAKWGAIEEPSKSAISTNNNHQQDAQKPGTDSSTSSHFTSADVAGTPTTVFSMMDAEGSLQKPAVLPIIDKPDVKVASGSSESVYGIMDSVEALRDLRCLKEFLDNDVVQVIERYQKEVDCKIRFHDLWYLFQPGVKVVAPAKQQMESSKAPSKARDGLRAYQTAYRVYSTVGGRHNLSDKGSDDSDSDEEEIFDREPGEEQSGRFRPNRFIIKCYYIDWLGTHYIPASHDFYILPFEGERDITSLEIFPTRFLSNSGSFRQNLVERGSKFVGLLDAKHMRYNGLEHVCHPCGCAYDYVNGKPVVNQPRSFTGEVIVDFREALKVDDVWRPYMMWSPLVQHSREVNEDWKTHFLETPAGILHTKPTDEIIVNDHSTDPELTRKAIENSVFLRQYNHDRMDASDGVQQILAEDDLLLLPSRVVGYVLRERFFAALDLKYLSNVSADPKGFDELELPGGHKEMVQALVREHFQNKSSESSQQDYDIIAGKGRGLIILLHGVPGVGKTSTAECVAAFTGRPLFPITCGDLGTTPASVEESLRDKFHLASTWNCVLLLDEADIFLAQRDRQNLERNAIVSVFLRVLEYYDGIPFLTTNRVGAFDEAFKSRIHVSLYYPELKEEQTLQIWAKNLARTRNIDAARAKQVNRPVIQIKEEKILEYAKKHFVEHKALGRWNGRQIRNAFQTAAALAVYHTNEQTKVPILGTTHSKTVAKATREFEEYIYQTMGSDENKRAFSREERAYSFTPEASMKGQGAKPNYETSSQTQLGHPQQQFMTQQSSLQLMESTHPDVSPIITFLRLFHLRSRGAKLTRYLI